MVCGSRVAFATEETPSKVDDDSHSRSRTRQLVARKAAQLRAEALTIRRGDSARDRWRIAAMLAHSHVNEGGLRRLLGWLPARSDEPREIRLRSGTSVLGRRGDGTVFFEQFGLEVYAVPLPRPVGTVVDLGANVGYAALRFSARYPEARLVCVEPAATSRRLLALNLQRNGIDAQIFGVAVVDEPGAYALRAARHFGGSWVARTSGGPIDGITLLELLDRAGVDSVDLLKVDIEGGERALFEGAAQWAPRVRSVVAELHDGFTHEDAERRLRPHGFRQLPLERGVGLDDLIFLARTSS